MAKGNHEEMNFFCLGDCLVDGIEVRGIAESNSVGAHFIQYQKVVAAERGHSVYAEADGLELGEAAGLAVDFAGLDFNVIGFQA
jgi:hypothetical protein